MEDALGAVQTVFVLSLIGLLTSTLMILAASVSWFNLLVSGCIMLYIIWQAYMTDSEIVQTLEVTRGALVER